MEAQKVTFLNKLIGRDSRQFIIPIYQRKYKWTLEQCNRLIDDIINAGISKKEHFTGSVIYKDKSSGSFTKTYLVDGQQRITTLLLIVKALNVISCDKLDDDNYKYIYNKTTGFLLADKDESSMGYKLLPGENDKDIFEAIMISKSIKELEDNEKIKEDKDNSLYHNYKEMLNRISELIKDGDYLRNIFYEGLSLLTIVEMILGTDDDPQAIFESINSLGLKLSNSDLIRNYLLMTNENQDTLYNQYWKPMQNDNIGENNMESFIFNYLMMKKSYSINSGDIYKEYVKYARDNNLSKEELLKDLYETSKIYVPFIKYSKSYSNNTNELMKELRDMAQTTAYPFLMKVFIDQKNEVITEDILDKVINLIIIYLVRRTICGVPTHSLRGFMLNLYNRIFKLENNKNRYFDSVYAFLSNLQTNDVLKSNSDVLSSLETFELYKNVKFATYLLYRLENGRYPNISGEVSYANDISIEHIMPQTLTEDWGDMLGENADEIHSKYLNTLGNLSLSSRSKNSIMSNESFIFKRDILNDNQQSKFGLLNYDIKNDQTKFTENDIIAREERLASIICSRYDVGTVNTSGIKFEETIEMICSKDLEEVYEGSQPISYKFLDKEIITNSFTKILVGVAKILYERNPERIRELASNNYTPWNQDFSNPALSRSNDSNSKDQAVAEDIRIHTNYNARYAVQCIAYIIEECGFDSSELIISLKKDSIKTENKLPKKERITIVKSALIALSYENKVIYSEATMPKNDDWIKFQTINLNKTFKLENVNTLWDGEKYPYVCYLEYCLSKNTIYLTLKNFKATNTFINKLSKHSNELQLENELINSIWLHLKKYKIEYKEILDSTDKVESLKNQIANILVKIDSDLENIDNVLKQED